MREMRKMGESSWDGGDGGDRKSRFLPVSLSPCLLVSLSPCLLVSLSPSPPVKSVPKTRDKSKSCKFPGWVRSPFLQLEIIFVGDSDR